MTTTLQPTDRVGEIAAHHPAAARIFERLGIDYCCAGRRTLDEACTTKSLSTSAVLAEIGSLKSQSDVGDTDWTAASMSELCDHIQFTHHAQLKIELPRMAGIIAKVIGAHGESTPELIELGDVFSGLQCEMLEHMAKEEQVLFPVLRAISGESPPAASRPTWIASGPIRVLMAEHDSAGAAMAKMRSLTHGFVPPPTACATYRVMLMGLAAMESDLHQHVHKENNILFPKALEALGVSLDSNAH